jgi:hypothetical protein
MTFFRAAALNAVKREDVEAIMAKLIEQAKAGEAWAIREFLDRVLGKPIATSLTLHRGRSGARRLIA